MIDAPLVLLRWQDSRQPNAAWRYRSDVREAAVECATVGWLIEHGDVLVVAQSLGDLTSPEHQVSGTMVIPARCVTSIKRLQESGEAMRGVRLGKGFTVKGGQVVDIRHKLGDTSKQIRARKSKKPKAVSPSKAATTAVEKGETK